MKRRANSQNNNLTLGLLILTVGLVLLLKKMGIFFPGWVFSWPMIFIVLGVIVLVKHKFQSGFGFVMLLFGTYFLLKEEFFLPFEIGQYLLPIGLILLGLYVILYRRSNRHDNWNDWGDTKKNIKKDPFSTGRTLAEKEFQKKDPPEQDSPKHEGPTFKNDGGDIVNSQAIFCGVQKRVLSKNFKGGKISTFFGGTEIDLSQADLVEEAYINIEVAFGGIKLIVPPHWDVQMDVTNVFAGIEDKRMYPQITPDLSKILMIRGTILFGGLEIKSF